MIVRKNWYHIALIALFWFVLSISVVRPTTVTQDEYFEHKEPSTFIGIDFVIDIKQNIRKQTQLDESTQVDEKPMEEKIEELPLPLIESTTIETSIDNNNHQNHQLGEDVSISSLIDESHIFHNSDQGSSDVSSNSNRVSQRIVKDSVNFQNRRDIVKGKRARSNIQHEVIIALRQRNVDQLEDILLSLSMPTSPQYGQYWTIDQIRQLTSDEFAFQAIEKYFESFNTKTRSTAKLVDIVHVSPFLEFAVVRASISTWEEILQTEFFHFHAAHHFESTSDLDNHHDEHMGMRDDENRYVIRAHEYSLPDELLPHVDAVFNVVEVWDVLQSMPWDNRVGDGLNPLQNSKSRNYYEYQFIHKQSNSDEAISPAFLSAEYVISDQLVAPFTSQAIFARGSSISVHSQDVQQFLNLFSSHISDTSVLQGLSSDKDNICLEESACESATMAYQYMTAIAPSATTSLYVISTADNNNNTSNFWTDWLLSISSMSSLPDVLYVDFYDLEKNVQPSVARAFNIEAMKLGIAGITIIASAGSEGVGGDGKCCEYNPVFPASSPFVTAVGSTQGSRISNSEQVSKQTSNGEGVTSGGGFSTLFTQPSWQSNEIANYLDMYCLLSPTSAPTFLPTFAPSPYPTITPSAVPTEGPTAAPSTVAPSVSPSIGPSAQPSLVPTIGPTAIPTEEPTASPSAAPSTISPTTNPTPGPSELPSTEPSNAPTTAPTEQPSDAPMEPPTEPPSPAPITSPSVEPTFSPTDEATDFPTENPSVAPSSVPTDVPSVSSTALPSYVPTISPTSFPTEEPTEVLSMVPTLFPSCSPSAIPSMPPSTSPSVAPSEVPSASPSVVPSSSPTEEPSQSPSILPTVNPSLEPSSILILSVAPTDAPWQSNRPTISPSVLTSQPSIAPTIEPIDVPTLTAAPFADPTMSPTVFSTAMPSEDETVFSPIPTWAPIFVEDTFEPSEEPTVEPTIEQPHHELIGEILKFPDPSVSSSIVTASLIDDHAVVNSETTMKFGREERVVTTSVISSTLVTSTLEAEEQEHTVPIIRLSESSCSFPFASTGRGYPDISLLTGQYAMILNGQIESTYGSGRQSAAVFAGMISLINSARIKQGLTRLGWINPALYHYQDRFVFDVTNGDNYPAATNVSSATNDKVAGFFAVSGWDAASGLGSVNFTAMFEVLARNQSITMSTAYPSQVPTNAPTTVDPTISPTQAPTTAKPTVAPTLQVQPVLAFRSSLEIQGVSEFFSMLRTSKQVLVTSVVETQAKVLNISSRYIEYVGYENVTSESRYLRALPPTEVLDVHALATNTSSSTSSSTASIKLITEITLPLIDFPAYASNTSKLLNEVTQKLSQAVSTGEMITALRVIASSFNLTIFNNATVAALEIGALSVVYPPSISPTHAPTFKPRPDTSTMFNGGAVAGLVVAGFVAFGALMGVVYWYILKRMTPKPKSVISAKLPIQRVKRETNINESVKERLRRKFNRSHSPAEDSAQSSELDELTPIALQTIHVQMRNSPSSLLDVRIPPKARLEAREKFYELNPHARSSPSLGGSSGSSTPSLPPSRPTTPVVQPSSSPQFGASTNNTKTYKHRLDDHWIIARYDDEVTL